MTSLMLNHVLVNEDGSLEVEWTQNGYIACHVFTSQEELQSFVDPIQNPDDGLKVLMASWLGVDATGTDKTILEKVRIEVDYSRDKAVTYVDLRPGIGTKIVAGLKVWWEAIKGIFKT